MRVLLKFSTKKYKSFDIFNYWYKSFSQSFLLRGIKVLIFSITDIRVSLKVFY